MDSTFASTVQSFSQMNYEQKKQKVISMLEVLKEWGNIFEDLWNLVHIKEEVSESILDMIFQVITKAMYALKSEEMEKALKKLENIKDKIWDIRQKEAQEQESAEDVLASL